MVSGKPPSGTLFMAGSDYSSFHKPSDWLFWIYNTLVAVFLLLMGYRITYRWLYLLSNIALIVLSAVLIIYTRRYPHAKWLRFLRQWYPFGYFFYLHWESGMIGKLFFNHRFDYLVASWDFSLFGDYLHNILYQFQPLWFSEFIHFTYFFYYILLFLPAVILYFQGDHLRFRNYVFDVSLLYLIHYTVFYIFPVVGPIEHHLSKFPDGVLFIPLMKLFYKIGDSPGGAMPSSHVSVAVLGWFWMLHIRRRWMPVLTFLVVCLIFSTVYLSYHYAIDSLVGFIVGVLFVVAMQYLRRRYGRETFI